MTFEAFRQHLRATRATLTWSILTVQNFRGAFLRGTDANGNQYCPITAVAGRPNASHHAKSIGEQVLLLAWPLPALIMEAADKASYRSVMFPHLRAMLLADCGVQQ